MNSICMLSWLSKAEKDLANHRAWSGKNTTGQIGLRSWFKESTERRKTSFLKQTVENADLHKAVLSKTMTTQEQCVKYDFIAPLTILTGKNLCFTTELSTKIHWNTRLDASDVFHMFTQSITVNILIYCAPKNNYFQGCAQ